MKVFDHGGRVFAVARQLGVSPEDILDFSASINPLGIPATVRDAVQNALVQAVHYPDSEATALRQALALHHGQAPEQFCVGNGSTELIYLLPRLLEGGRKRALLIAPTFSEYGYALQQAGWEVAQLVLSDDDGFVLPLAALAERLSSGYDLLFFCNPGNPTGRLYLRDEVAAVADLCREEGTFLVVDEAFMDFCEDESAKHLVAAGDAGVVLRSMTKFWALPGLRLGYAMASAAVTARLAAIRPPWSVNHLAQAAGLAALADHDYQRRTLAGTGSARTAMAERLAALPDVRVFPAAANYLLVKLSGYLTASVLQERLLGQRMLIRDCSSFQGLGERFVRLAVRGVRENDLLLAAMEQEIG